MHFQLRDHACHGGEGATNEDHAGVGRHIAWILDGATDLLPEGYFPGTTDARWLVDRVDAKLCQLSADGTRCASSEIYRQLARHLREELTRSNYPPDRILPSCSCGIARLDLDGNGVWLTSVGDVYLFAVSTTTLLSTNFFSSREAAGVQRARKRLGANEQEVTTAQDREAIARRRQQYIAGIGGRVVLSANEGALERGIQGRWTPTRSGDLFLLCTDGFARLIHPYRIYGSWPELSAAVLAHGLAVMLERLRQYESHYFSSRHNYKSSDDACAMLISVEEDLT